MTEPSEWARERARWIINDASSLDMRKQASAAALHNAIAAALDKARADALDDGIRAINERISLIAKQPTLTKRDETRMRHYLDCADELRRLSLKGNEQ